MKVWIASFLVLFGMAELYQWLKHFTLPLPIYILGGAFLAIASNYERRAGFPFPRPNEQPSTANPPAPQPPKPIAFTISREDEKSERGMSR